MEGIRGVIEVIVTYLVHTLNFMGIMTLIGPALLLLLLIRRRRHRRKPPPISGVPSTEKKALTGQEKDLLAAKIRGSRTENLTKTFAGRSNPVYRTMAIIGLFLLFFILIVIVQ